MTQPHHHLSLTPSLPSPLSLPPPPPDFPSQPPEKLLILGAGVSGLAATKLALHLGVPVWIWEEGNALDSWPEEVLQHSLFRGRSDPAPEDYTTMTFIPGPGIPPSHYLHQRGRELCPWFLSEVDWGWSFLSANKDIELICVTGTNGKSGVVSTLVHALTELGVLARALGNIGTAVSEEALRVLRLGPFLSDRASQCSSTHFLSSTFSSSPPLNPSPTTPIAPIYVMELSSYQLAQSRTLDHKVSIITNIAVDHLRWHGDVQSYVASKWQIMQRQKLSHDKASGVQAGKSHHHLLTTRGVLKVAEGFGWSVPPHYQVHLVDDAHRASKDESDTPEITSVALSDPEHDLSEGERLVLRALELVQQAGRYDRFRSLQAVRSFPGLEYRGEVIARQQVHKDRECLWVNDGKATNFAATAYALRRFRSSGPVVLILGGRRKQGDDPQLLKAYFEDIAAVVVFGDDRDELAEYFCRWGYGQEKTQEKALGQGETRPSEDLDHLGPSGLGGKRSDNKIASPRSKLWVCEHLGELTEIRGLRRLISEGGVGCMLFSPGCESWDQYPSYRERGSQFTQIARQCLADKAP